MMLTAKKRTLLLIFFLAYLTSYSQTGIGVGYNMGRYVPSLRNMEIMTYEFNQQHPNYAHKYEFVNLYRGFTAVFYHNNYKFGRDLGQEFRWSNRVITATASGADNPTDTIYKHKLRVAMNTFSWGGYFMPHKNIKIGIDWDLISRCTFTKRVAPEDQFKDESRERIFVKKGFFTFGFTFFAEYKLGIFTLRPYYQVDVLPGETSYGYNTYSFKTANIGVSLCIVNEGN